MLAHEPVPGLRIPRALRVRRGDAPPLLHGHEAERDDRAQDRGRGPEDWLSVRVWTTPEADAQARAADAWWRENRQASPDLFHQELIGAADLLAAAPEIGRLYPEGGVPAQDAIPRLLRPRSRAGGKSRYWQYGVPFEGERPRLID